MSVYISGGCKNGKSLWAQRIAHAYAGEGPLYYLATMLPRDAEDEARVRRHQAERAGWGFITLERGRDILRALDEADPAGAFLIDSVTALLANEMFDADGFHPEAGEKVAGELEAFVARAPKTVLVSDFIFSDAAIYDETTEAYRAALAHIDRRMAQCCGCALEAVAGQLILHKGVLPI